jgi:hypothetical protein
MRTIKMMNLKETIRKGKQRVSGKVLLYLAGLLIASASCKSQSKEDVALINSVKGTITGYNKCKNDDAIVVGIFILTEKKETLLAYNIPRSTLVSLLDIDIYENVPYGAYPVGILNKEIPPVEFDYKEAKEGGIITTICPQSAMLPGISVDVEQIKQIIITIINKKEIK